MPQAIIRMLCCNTLVIVVARATLAPYPSEKSSAEPIERSVVEVHGTSPLSAAKRNLLRKEDDHVVSTLKDTRSKSVRARATVAVKLGQPPAPPPSSPNAPAPASKPSAPAPPGNFPPSLGGSRGPVPPGSAPVSAPAAPGTMSAPAPQPFVQPAAAPPSTNVVALPPSSPSGPKSTCGGDAKGAPCKFPFVYGLDLSGIPKTYSECTSMDHDQPWCITDTVKGFWGNCNCGVAATPSPASSISNGRPECECVAIDAGLRLTTKGVKVDIQGNGVMYPAELVDGGCKAWDAGLYPESCNIPSPESWCAKKWCYVDPCQCSLTRKISSYFGADMKFNGNPLHYSYKTCNEEDSYSGANTCGVQTTLSDCSALSHCKWEVWAAFPQGVCQSKEVSCGPPTPPGTPPAPPPDSVGNDRNPEPDVPEVMIWRNKTMDNQVATAKVVFVAIQVGGISFPDLTSYMYDRIAYSLIRDLEEVTGIEAKHIETTIQPIAYAKVDDDVDSFVQAGSQLKPMKNKSVLLQAAITLPEAFTATDVQALIKAAEKMLSQSLAATVSKLEGLTTQIVVQQPTVFITLPGAIAGTDACENKDLTWDKCMKVGCCKYDTKKGCQSAVGKSFCNSMSEELPALEPINFGNELCPCIGIAGAGGDNRMIIGTLNATYPMDVGTSCKAWDLGRYPGFCDKSDPNMNEMFCKQSWCFVDPCKCSIDVVPRKASSFLPVSKSEGRPLYYSYRTCGGTDQWTSEQHKNACVNQFDKESCKARAICDWLDTDPGVCAGKEQLEVCTDSMLFAPKRNTLQLGHEACPCIGVTAIPGSALVRIDDMGILYPAEAGKTCGAWDNGRYPHKCTLGSDHQSPGMNEGWCAQTWCYVDPCNCNLPIAPKQSTYFPDALFQGRSLYYSYATCGATDYYTTAESPSACISKASEALCALGKGCVWSHGSCMSITVARGCKDARLPPSLLRKPVPPQTEGNPGPPLGSLASTRRRRETEQVKKRHYGNGQCKCVGIADAEGTMTTTLDGNEISISVDFGSYCNSWNAVQSFVEGYSQTEAWCYVDPCECDIDSPPQKSEVFKDAQYKGRPRYYSYATCGRQEAVQISSAMCRKQDSQSACEELGGGCGWSTTLQKCGSKEAMSDCDAKPYFQTFGYESCPCIGWSGNLQGKTRVLLGDDLVDYPVDVGATCEPWDNGRYPDACTLDSTQQTPGKGTDWCIKRWCFVDPCQCSLKIRPKPSSYFKDGRIRGKPIFYSYATCGEFESSTEDLLDINATVEDPCESYSTDKQVTMFFKIRGLDYNTLTPAETLSIKASCMDRIGSEIGIPPNKVGIELSAGSVNVNATVPVLSGFSAFKIQSKLSGAGGVHVTENVVKDLTKDFAMLLASRGTGADGRGGLECTYPEVMVTTLTTTTTLMDQAVLVNRYQRVFGSTPVAGIEVGNPPRQVDVIFDTGSDKLVIKTLITVLGMLKFAGEEGITKNYIRGTLLLYDHDGSSTWAQKTTTKDGKTSPKKSQITYGSGSAVTLEGLDDVGIGGRRLSKFGVSEIVEDSLDLLHTSEKIFGIMGLMHMKNRSYGESAFSRLRDAGAMTAFGYCLTDVEGNMGAVIWGDNSTEGRQVLVEGQRHWAVRLFNVKVPGRGNLVPSDSGGEDYQEGGDQDLEEDSGDDEVKDVDMGGASALEMPPDGSDEDVLGSVPHEARSGDKVVAVGCKGAPDDAQGQTSSSGAPAPCPKPPPTPPTPTDNNDTNTPNPTDSNNTDPTDPTTNGTDPTDTPTPAPTASPVVTFSMTITGLDYDALVANATMYATVMARAIDAVKQYSGDGSNVTIVFTKGSVLTDVTVTPPTGTSAVAVAATLTTQINAVVNQVVGNVASVPGVSSVSNGQIGSTGVTQPQVEPGATPAPTTNATGTETVVTGDMSLKVTDAKEFTFNLATQAAMKAAVRQLLGLTENTAMSFIMSEGADSTGGDANVDAKYRVVVTTPSADLTGKVQSLNVPDANGLSAITATVVAQLQAHGWQTGAQVTTSTCELETNQGPPTPWPAPAPPPGVIPGVNAPCEAWTEQGYKCILPFKYKNVTYYSCTTVGQEKSGLYWCLAQVDVNGNQMVRANCKPNLPCNPQAIPPPPPMPGTPPPPGAPRRRQVPFVHVFQPCTRSSGGCAAIIDTGSNIIGGPRLEVAKLARLLQVSKDCDNLHKLPDIQITLGQTTLLLPPIGYVMKIKIPAWMKQIMGNSNNLNSRHKAWSNAMKEVMKRSGVDLRPAMGVDKGWDLSRLGQPPTDDMEYLCLPALTSMDIMTQLGPLWVIGKPIFARYYARWSFANGASSPKIFFKETTQTSACNTTTMPPMAEARFEGDDVAGKSDSSGYNRESHKKKEGPNRGYIDTAAPAEGHTSIMPRPAKQTRRGQPQAMDFEDIRHPYWVHELHGVL